MSRQIKYPMTRAGMQDEITRLRRENAELRHENEGLLLSLEAIRQLTVSDIEHVRFRDGTAITKILPQEEDV